MKEQGVQTRAEIERQIKEKLKSLSYRQIMHVLSIVLE